MHFRDMQDGYIHQKTWERPWGRMLTSKDLLPDRHRTDFHLCWDNVKDGGPTLSQTWVELLGCAGKSS